MKLNKVKKRYLWRGQRSTMLWDVITSTVMLLLLSGGCRGPLNETRGNFDANARLSGISKLTAWILPLITFCGHSCGYWCNGCIESHLSNEKRSKSGLSEVWRSVFNFYINDIYFYWLILFYFIVAKIIWHLVRSIIKAKRKDIHNRHIFWYLTALGIALETELRETLKMTCFYLELL
jgi:hypothetical protein